MITHNVFPPFGRFSFNQRLGRGFLFASLTHPELSTIPGGLTQYINFLFLNRKLFELALSFIMKRERAFSGVLKRIRA